MIDDSSLVENYLLGDETAFAAIVNRYLKPVYSFVFRLVGNIEESNDITQEVFLKVWKNIATFDRKKNFKPWIFTIARNTVYDWLRKQKPMTFTELDTDTETFADTLMDEELLPDEIVFQQENIQAVQKALKELAPVSREIVFLKTGEYLTFEEIAQVIGAPMNTVKSLYRRALITLKKKLSNAPK